jgi:hypothetical protein
VPPLAVNTWHTLCRFTQGDLIDQDTFQRSVQREIVAHFPIQTPGSVIVFRWRFRSSFVKGVEFPSEHLFQPFLSFERVE